MATSMDAAVSPLLQCFEMPPTLEKSPVVRKGLGLMMLSHARHTGREGRGAVDPSQTPPISPPPPPQEMVRLHCNRRDSVLKALLNALKINLAP
jgi:hypothetical protein